MVWFALWTSPVLSAPSTPSEEIKALLVLNRLGYGPRPGEVQRVAETGVENFIRVQLQPAELPHDKVELLFSRLPALQKSRAELVASFQASQRARQERQKALASIPEGTEAPKPPEGFRALQQEIQQLLPQLQMAKLGRAVLSERQLEEVLTDFWFNHFNVDARKQLVLPLLVDYEASAIRAHVFGSFREMLGAVARHGAMLVYLDNWRSTGGRAAQPRPAMVMMGDGESDAEETVPRRGLNENYGRELLELHTLGVEAGYSQDDVRTAARIFTGWTIDPESGDFIFRPRAHDDAPKVFMGQPLPDSSGVDEGEHLLDLLATHPATARHLAHKLLQRFVADTPPQDYIERVAQAFLQSGGQLRPTYEAIFFDPQFFPVALASPKLRTPWEFAVAALRATDSQWRPKGALANSSNEVPDREKMAAEGMEAVMDVDAPSRNSLSGIIALGQPPYQCAPPTGFPEDSRHWASAGSALARMKFALQLTGGGLGGIQPGSAILATPVRSATASTQARQLSRLILGRPASLSTLKVIEESLAVAPTSKTETSPPAANAVALLLASPDFQNK